MTPFSKAEEIALLASFVRRLPPGAGYLREIFKDLLPEIERAITSDFVFVPFLELCSAKLSMQSDLTDAEKALKDKESQLRQLERQVASKMAEFEAMKSTINSTARRLLNQLD